jgi:acyl carrier protein
MNPEDLTTTIGDVVKNILGVDESELTPDGDFILDFNASTQDLDKIQSDLEEVFEITLPDLKDIEGLSLAELSNLIEDSIL